MFFGRENEFTHYDYNFIRKFLQQLIVPTEENIKYDVVVGGLGPAGLDVALRAALEGKKVLALTDRDFYSREQVLRLDQDIAELLFGKSRKERRQLEKDGLITVRRDKGMKLGEYYVTIETGKLEEYLRTLQTKQGILQNIDLTILRLPKASEGRNFEFDKQEHGMNIPRIEEVISFGHGRAPSKGELETNLIQFKYFVAADGANHRIADQVNEIVKAPIQYHERQIEQLHQYHAAVVFKIPEGLSQKFERALQKKNHKGANDQELRDQNWRLASRPESRVLKAGNTLYIGTETPKFTQGLDRAERNKMIEKWARSVLKDHLPESLIYELTYTVDNNLTAEQKKKKEQLRISPFNIQLDEANQNYASLWADVDRAHNGLESLHEQTSYFFQVGDALRKPHYHTGSGAATGFRVNNALIDFFKSDESIEALASYDNRVNKIRANNRVKVDNYLQGRREREATARLRVLKNLYRVLDVHVKARAFLAFFAMIFAPISPTARFYRQRFLEAYTYRAFFAQKIDAIQQNIVDLNFVQANKNIDESQQHLTTWRSHDITELYKRHGIKKAAEVTRKDNLHINFFHRCDEYYSRFREEGQRADQELKI